MTFATVVLSTILALAQSMLTQAQSGWFDRTELTSSMSSQLTQEQAAHFVSTVGRLGKPSTFVLESKTAKGSYTKYTYRVSFADATVDEQIVLDASGKVAGLWFTPAPVAEAPGDASALALAKSLLRQAQAGSLDRGQLTSQAAASFTSDATARMKQQLAPLGSPTSFTLQSRSKDATGTTYYYRVAFAGAGMYEELTLDTGGKVAGLWFKPAR
jgi:hypothetical protein